jgi:predicted phage terminase large subunit-like protein
VGNQEWRPNPGPQSDFLSLRVYEALYGGAAGGGKSEALLMGALRNITEPTYRAILFRRTYPELYRSLIERSYQWYPHCGGKYSTDRKQWRFPSGAVIEFGHLEHDVDVFAYASAEYQYLGFDELTSFTERQYTYLLSRARSSTGIPVRIRSATNPGGEGHEWVMRRWGPWLDRSSEYKGKRAAPSEILHYRNGDKGEEWCDKGPGVLGRVFIPARVVDNPHLHLGDPGYLERLSGLDPVTRAQLRDGDWLARPAAGMYFKPAWFEVVAAAPAEAERVRYWDRAGTEEKPNADPDYTVGLRLARHRGVYYVEDIVRFRGTPKDVEDRIKQTASFDGRDVMIGIEQDPGQAGKFEAAYYVRALDGYNVRTFPVTGDKITRAQPASAQAEARNIKLVPSGATWGPPFLQELEAFPEGGHDDQVDALSGAHAALSGWAHPVNEASYDAPTMLQEGPSEAERVIARRVAEICGD